MQFSSKINTILLCIYILLVVAYAAFDFSVTSFVGLMEWSVMILFVSVLLFRKNYVRSVIGYMIAVVIFFLFHIMKADTSLLTAGLFLVNMLLFLFLPDLHVNVRVVAYLLFGLFAANLVIGFEEVLYSPFAGGVSEYFSGIFRNSNTNGNFACCVLAAILLFLDNKKMRMCTVLLFLVYLYACKSRNALLFVVLVVYFYNLLSSKRFAKFALPSFIVIWVGSLFYLTIIEPAIDADFEVFGKSGNSAGRSVQILLTMSRFPITFLGVGATVPNDYVIASTEYSIHNMYVNTFYAMGWGYIVLYFIFVFKLYYALHSNLAKAFLMGFLMYFMFEPGTAFGVQLIVSLPFIILLIKLGQEKYEDRTLYLELQHRRGGNDAC